MTTITNLDSLFISGLSATVLALLTWIVLREARGPVVNLWCVGGVMGAVYAFATGAILPTLETGESWWIIGGLAFAQFGIFLKWIALRLMREVPMLWGRAIRVDFLLRHDRYAACRCGSTRLGGTVRCDF